MRDLEERLHEADGLTPPDLWSDVRQRSHAPTIRRGRVGTIVFALAVSGAAVGALVVAFAHSTTDRTPGSATRPPKVIGASVERQIPVGGPPADVAVGDGSAWVLLSGEADASDKLVRIDASTDEVTSEISLHGLANSVVVDDHGAWVSLHEGVEGLTQTSASVVRIDPTTNKVTATIPDMGGSLALGAGSVWGSIRTPGGSDLLQLDPATTDVTSRAHLTVVVQRMVFVDGVIWAVGVDPATNDVNGTLVRIDPASGDWTRIATPADGTLYGPVAGAGKVWVGICCPGDGNAVVVVPFDASTGLPVHDPVPVGVGLPFADGLGNLWLLSERGTLFGLNESTLELTSYLKSDWPAGNTTAALDESAGAVWVANLQPTVTKIKLEERSPGPPPLWSAGEIGRPGPGPWSYVPPTEQVGDETHVRVTLPDGTQADLQYATALNLTDLGMRVYARAGLCTGWQPFYGDGAGDLYQGVATATFIANDGRLVELHAGRATDILVTGIGGWTITLSVFVGEGGMTQEQLRACAEQTRISITPDGWPVITPPAGAEPTDRNWGPNQGPWVEFGDLAVSRTLVTLWPGPCAPSGGEKLVDGIEVRLQADHASWCEPGGRMRIDVEFEPGSSFFRDVLDGLRIDSVRLQEP